MNFTLPMEDVKMLGILCCCSVGNGEYIHNFSSQSDFHFPLIFVTETKNHLQETYFVDIFSKTVFINSSQMPFCRFTVRVNFDKNILQVEILDLLFIYFLKDLSEIPFTFFGVNVHLLAQFSCRRSGHADAARMR
jgi:hypothetical protein